MKKTAQHRQLVKSNKAPQSAATFNKKAIAVTVAMMFASGMANANPTGGEFAAGVGAISSEANLTTIHQTSDRAIVNWQSFSTNAGEAVKFVQPSANAAILNRVVGDLPSSLNGVLEGNGRVYLVNPNGIILGANGVINVNGGFVASTQGISDSAFMQGGALVFTGESTGSIQILGKIKSEQGDIILIAPKTEVKAGAELIAGQTIKLVAANEVELSNGKITVKPKTSDAGQITVEGALQAAQVQLEAHNNNLGALAINTTGTIRATGTQTNPDGSVSIMAYGEGSNIKVSGNISAQNNDATKQGGRIIVGRNEETGALAKSADVSGASFITNQGFVETSGHDLNVDGAKVIAKDWLLDPDNIDITDDATNPIAGYSKIKASDITNNLNKGTSVTIATTASARENQPAYMGGVSTGDGNIVVNADILKSASLDANGVTLANDATNSAKLTLLADNGITLNKAIKSSSGTLDVTLTANGNAASATNSAGIVMANGSSIDANGGLVTLNGTSKFQTGGFNKGGLYMFVGTSIKGGSVRIDAKILGTTGGTAYGAFFDHKTTITATAGDIDVTGTLTGAATGNALFSGSNPGGGVGLTWSATGKVNISGDLTGSTNASSAAVQLGSMRINAGGDVGITAKTPNAGAGAIIMQYSGTGWNPAIKSGGNISILTNQGAIALNNFDAANTSTGLGITGNSLTIDNTGGQWVNGVYTKDGGYSTSTSWSGVQLNGVAGSVVVTGNVNIFGNSQSSAGNAGVNISAGLKGAAVSVDGTANTGNGIYSGQTIESASGDVKMTGVSSTSSALSLQGAITASNNVEITGTNTGPNNASSVAYLTKAVTASNGTLRITADTAGSATQALNLNGATLTTTSGKDVTLTTDSINLAGNINAGAGTVTIQNKNAGVKVDLGGADGGSATATSRTLGLSNAELSKITAAKTVIGSNNAGNMTVFSAITTNDGAGNITLQTGGNILIDKALTVASNKNLTLNGAGNTSAITQNAAITATNLELLGDNATHTLTHTGNTVATLAANSKAINYVNSSALALGAVNTTGVNATGDVSIATQTGNLTIAENVSTTATSATALVLNAGKSSGVGAVVGDDEGGNIVVSLGKTVSVGSGGSAQLMTGSITGDTSVAGLATAGNFRYNSDESSTNYNTALSSGLNVIYREKPTLTVNVNSVSKTYDGLTFTGGNGFTEAGSSGLKNGDALTGATATAVYGGTAQSAKNASSYTLSASESNVGKSALGYEVIYNIGALTVNQKPVTITAAGSTVTYDGSQKIDGLLPNSGLVAGDNVGIVGLGKGVEPGLYASSLGLIGSDATNYAPTFENATLTIRVANGELNNANTSLSNANVPLIATNLSPVSFGFAAAAGATAAGEVEGSCDAWSQRAGAGSVAMVSLLRPFSAALRHAKTDSMDAMTGGQALSFASDAGESPCGSAALANKQAGL